MNGFNVALGLGWGAIVATAFVAPSASANPTVAASQPGAASAAAAPADPQLARLVAAKHSLKWNWVPPGKTAKYGHAEVLIDGSLETVRARVTDYGKYREFAPRKFKQARIVAKQGETTDVYFRIPILKGLGSLSYVLRFGPAQRPQPDIEVIEGKFVSGTSVKDVDLKFTLRQIENNRTILSADILAVPSFPAPQDAIDEELRDAAMNAVDAVNDQVSKKSPPAGG